MVGMAFPSGPIRTASGGEHRFPHNLYHVWAVVEWLRSR